MDEYFSTCDEKEALVCVAEKFSPANIHFFVEATINK